MLITVNKSVLCLVLYFSFTIFLVLECSYLAQGSNYNFSKLHRQKLLYGKNLLILVSPPKGPLCYD